nr:PREDICTED: uncharacterized protein LOC107076577 isoform X2 [Lepisosteus oculatus]
MLFFFFGKQNTLGAVTVGAAIAAPPRASGDQQQIKSWPPGEPSRKAVAQRRGRVPSDQPKCTAAGRRRQLGGLRPMRRGGGAKGPEGREGNMSCVRGMKEAGSARSKPMGRRAVRPFCCLEEARGNICGRRGWWDSLSRGCRRTDGREKSWSGQNALTEPGRCCSAERQREREGQRERVASHLSQDHLSRLREA